jgi:hypothetical protein
MIGHLFVRRHLIAEVLVELDSIEAKGMLQQKLRLQAGIGGFEDWEGGEVFGGAA